MRAVKWPRKGLKMQCLHCGKEFKGEGYCRGVYYISIHTLTPSELDSIEGKNYCSEHCAFTASPFRRDPYEIS